VSLRAELYPRDSFACAPAIVWVALDEYGVPLEFECGASDGSRACEWVKHGIADE